MKVAKAVFRTAILQRDGEKCQICGSCENLNAHHINVNEYDCETSNGICLCRECHLMVHRYKKPIIWRHHQLKLCGGNVDIIFWLLTEVTKARMNSPFENIREKSLNLDAELEMYTKTIMKRRQKDEQSDSNGKTYKRP